MSVGGVLAALTAVSSASAANFTGDPAATCGGLAGAAANAVQIDSATMQTASPLAVSERAPTPAARVTPANPPFCKVLGHIEPVDRNAPPIRFQVNLPVEWNGRSLQYGGGGFNGVLITGLGLPPAYPFDKPRELMIYRILMELTSNIFKHSGATESTIQIVYHATYLELIAEDNGHGFSSKSTDGIGIKNVRSRVDYLGGQINIDSGHAGTTIIIQIPYKKI